MAAGKRKWVVDFVSKKSAGEAPPGYNPNFRAQAPQKASAPSKQELHKKMSRNAALAPGKNILMTMFMLWMSGNSVHIFSIMITFYTTFGAIRGLFSTQSTFKKFDELGVDTVQDKAIFALVQLVTLGIALYKCNSLGVLPTTPSDFTFRYPVVEPLELGTL